jgi:hypothetical protein
LDSQPDGSLFRGYLAFFAGQQVSLLGSSVVQFVVIWWVTITTKSAWFLTDVRHVEGVKKEESA